jgi:predicted DNA-binding transcriptional regulator AlpA
MKERSALSAVRPVPRRGLSREEAAMYIGIGTSKFDEMVADRRMPRPRRIDGRKVWDVLELDAHFVDLPRDGEVDSSWNDFDAARGISNGKD